MIGGKGREGHGRVAVNSDGDAELVIGVGVAGG